MNVKTDVRTQKLSRVFEGILRGKQPLTRFNSAQFIEAICVQPNPVTCISRLTTSDDGLVSLQKSMHFDLSTTFFNGIATGLLKYLQDPTLKEIGGGEFLNRVLLKIVEPPVFWADFAQAFRSKTLGEDAQISFAWLLLQLIMLPRETSHQYRELAQDPAILEMITALSSPTAKAISYKIKNVLATYNSPDYVGSDYHPGGRHDNDFADFREIAIVPTADEITSLQPPFLRPSEILDDPNTKQTRLATHLDNQFRLLREDMIYEMREELHISLGKKKGHRRGLVIDDFKFHSVHCGKDVKRCKWGIALECQHDFPQFKQVEPKNRRKYLIENPKFLRHLSQSSLLIDGDVVAFPTINRDEDLLAKDPPIIVVQLDGEASVTKTLLKLKTATRIQLIQIDCAMFSYEPVLKTLQNTKGLSLSEELLFWVEDSAIGSPPFQPQDIIQAIKQDPSQNIQSLLKTSKPITLDASQASSLLSGLTQNVSLIQGPPGTGKSFIGALLAKVLHDFTSQIILVVCYTNHALDQFLEDLMDIGIPQTSMVRLGGKSTQRTAPFVIHDLQKQNTGRKRTRADWIIIDHLKSSAEHYYQRLVQDFEAYKRQKLSYDDLLTHLEFDEPEYFEAFTVPPAEEGMITVWSKGRAVNKHYLLDRWIRGQDAGIFKSSPRVLETVEVWDILPSLRKDQLAKWESDILKEQVENIYKISKDYNSLIDQLMREMNASVTAILKSKRIIGCTTTGAAKYSNEIQAASPNILLVEEAGEILESHILTALGAETKQLILIGDHQQLRPKVNHYLLTIEKGEGYDLNRSLFERLVLKGYPHQRLTQQHRMRPEISQLIRELTYPDLIDAPTTKNRADLRGVQDNIIFINHDHPEDETPQLADRRDMNTTSSKQNSYEVQMVLKILRYLAQQGYGTEEIVILTPYLGQLQKLQMALKKDNDPILDDLDSYELVRAGLLTPATAKMSKRPIRIATIGKSASLSHQPPTENLAVDNYQGEEKDIVIVSLTRSNPDHDIGFMSSPERLNVLLSRARNALIMLGNAETFLKSRKGKGLWTRLFDMFKLKNYLHDGFPVKCERHPDRIALLREAADFDGKCPGGGCCEPCDIKLNCGLHLCPSKCHQLIDHSKMPCEHIMASKCPDGHDQSWKCHQKPPVTCPKCEKKARLEKEKQQKAFERQQKREADQLRHDQELAKLDSKIALEKEKIQDTRLAQERANAIRQKEKDLEGAISLAAQRLQEANNANKHSTGAFPTPKADSSQPQHSRASRAGNTTFLTPASGPSPPSTMAQPPKSTPKPTPKSPSQEEWLRQKDMEGASNDAIDDIMAMIGLEDVKKQVLQIRAKIELTHRQGTSMKGERFNIVLQGNPGTGKTTVARLYAKLLTSVQVLPGSEFVETTGSRLANDGVPGIKKIVEDVIKAGGGAIFVDEAYQLTSEHNFQGKQVLDFLLAEMENNIGVIVFILAGYNKQMEKFFEHNPGLTSRVPYSLQFADYDDDELLEMLVQQIQKKWGPRMKVDDGIRGLYSRIAVKRLGRCRGRDGFGNARDLRNLFDKICGRQANRIAEQRKKGMRPDDFQLLKADFIGPDPAEAKVESKAWESLQSLIGLKAVKESVTQLFDLIVANYQRELVEKEPLEVSLNRVFLGSPGTGKTSVAKQYGRILADLGLLSNGEVVIKNPSDFIGSVLGESERNTKAILANTVGKVLIIDEAYMLYGGASGSGNHQDLYKTAVIDTMVAEVQSVPGEDRCVLLLGYKSEMENMFQNVNPGLSRRFAIENAFHFDDFTDSELMEILNLKLKLQHLTATDAAKHVAIEVLSRARNRPNFGNAGEVENLLSQAKGRFQTRQKLLPVKQRSFEPGFEPQDFDPDFNRREHASTNLDKLFEDIVGSEAIIEKLRGYQNVAHRMKLRGKDARDQIPMNFVFKGPPGTGKTTVARKMGQVFYDMGLLSSTEVVECSASDLVGQYIGHTGPKTRKLFEKALGKVLFVDEAYRLSEGHFTQEAIDELVGLLTHETFRSKLVVILAGYDEDMNRLLGVNRGLSSRFQEDILFPNMPLRNCMEVLSRELKKKEIVSTELNDPSSVEYKEVWALLEELSRLPSWGNAREIVTLSKEMANTVFRNTSNITPDAELQLAGKDAVACTRSMLETRQERGSNVATPRRRLPDNLFAPPPTNSGPTISIKTEQKTKEPDPEPKKEERKEEKPPGSSDERDAGVSDGIWFQLQVDKRVAEVAAERAQEEMRALEQLIDEEKWRAERELSQAKALVEAEARSRDAAERAEFQRKMEEARVRELMARAEAARKAAELEKKRQAELAERKRESMAQAKLRAMGVCVAGFRWIKQNSGYRCAGGSHWVSDSQLGL